MLGSDYLRYDMIGLARLIRTRQISELELLEFTISKIEEINPQLNAVSHRFYDRAKLQIQQGTSAGIFQGVPFLLKDLGSDYADTSLTNGSMLFKHYVSTFNSAVVDRYVQAGLVIAGRTTSSEMGHGAYTETKLDGPTKNPWAEGYSAGGSSGGAGALVAARVVPAAHGSDAGGSIRVPAAWCGVFGLKPSRGLVPNGPTRGEGLGNFAHHALSLTVRDNAALLDAITAEDPGAPYRAQLPTRPFRQEVGIAPGRLRMAFVRQAGDLVVHPDAVAATDQAAALCESLGHHIDIIPYPIELEQWWKNQSLIWASDTHARMVAFETHAMRMVQESDLDRWTWLNYQAGRSIDAASLMQAIWDTQTATRRFSEIFRDFDIIAMPAVNGPPMKLGTIASLPDLASISQHQAQLHPFSSMFNWSGLPAMSVPLHWNADGLPVGMQFGAAWGRDDLLFRLAGQLEVAAPWARRRPPTTVR